MTGFTIGAVVYSVAGIATLLVYRSYLDHVAETIGEVRGYSAAGARWLSYVYAILIWPAVIAAMAVAEWWQRRSRAE